MLGHVRFRDALWILTPPRSTGCRNRGLEEYREMYSGSRTHYERRRLLVMPVTAFSPRKGKSRKVVTLARWYSRDVEDKARIHPLRTFLRDYLKFHPREPRNVSASADRDRVGYTDSKIYWKCIKHVEGSARRLISDAGRVPSVMHPQIYLRVAHWNDVTVFDDRNTFVTLCCWQKLTIIGRQTPGAGFLSSISGRARSVIAITSDLFSSLKSLSGYAVITQERLNNPRIAGHVDIHQRR